MTNSEDNDTPVQSQSEREKTVAGNEGGSVRTTVGVKLPWSQLAANRLMTSHINRGVEDKLICFKFISQAESRLIESYTLYFFNLKSYSA